MRRFLRWELAALFLLFFAALFSGPRYILDVSVDADVNTRVFVYYRESTDLYFFKKFVYVQIPHKAISGNVALPPSAVEAWIKVLGREGRPAKVVHWRLSHRISFFNLAVPIASSGNQLVAGPPIDEGPTVVVPLAATSPLVLRALEAGLWTLVLGLLLFSRGETRPRPSPALPRWQWLACFVVLLLTAGWFLRERSAARWPKYKLHLLDQSGFSLAGARGGVYVQLDPFTLYRNVASFTGGHYTTDAQGWRVSQRKEKVASPAVILGSSAAFGWGVEQDAHTFTALLNELNPNFVFHNAAVIGWHAGQELSEMTHTADKLRPKLYVSFNGFNELFYRDDQGSDFNSGIRRDVETRLRSLLAWRREESPQFDVPRRQGRVADAVIIEQYLANLERMHLFATARGARYIVVIQPDVSSRAVRSPLEREAIKSRRSFQGFNPEGEFGERYRQLALRTTEFCRQRGIQVVDLNKSKRLTHSRWPVFLDWIHPNEHGHRLIAEILNEAIEAK